MSTPASSYAQRLLSGQDARGEAATIREAATVAVEGCLIALQSLASDAVLPSAAEVLNRRAQSERLPAPTAISARGASRLLPARDGLVAVSLARPTDHDLVPALVEAQPAGDPWDQVARWLLGVTQAQAAERLTLLNLAYGLPGETRASMPWTVSGRGVRDGLRVVSFAALWAGPLCAQLLRRLGCEVVKVEDPARPDGMRRGSPVLFAELHEGIEICERPLADAAEIAASADIVIEGSRPRALRRHGLIAEEHPGTWVSITGHGRESDRVAFGDDAAVSGGLVDDGCFIGDAVADPLTGVHAALAAWLVHHDGGGLVDISLARTAAVVAGLAC